ncbi:HAMP domain-containing histidine kinase [candidate division KSB1 bacterium]|nr:HAMP domain-containing histidine kinase [candidate division KSB1 bacterium]
MTGPVKFFGWIGRSILLKLGLILLLSGLLVNLIVTAFVFYQMPRHMRTVMHKNIDAYLDYLIADIGVPPDTLRAANLSRELSIGIRIETPRFSWTSATEEIFQSKKPHILQPHRPRIFSRMPLVRSPNDSTHFAFNIRFVHREDAGSARHLVLLMVLTCVFILHFWLIKKILRPVKQLSAGVSRISTGNLEQKIPKLSNDELGRLTDGFNLMMINIRQRILARDQLLLDVSHELRSPLTRIKIALEFMPESDKKADIQNDVREIEKMITEILETERLSHGHGGLVLEPTDISKLIKSVVAEYKDRKPAIKIQKPLQPAVIKLDSERIRMAIRNVLDNAVKYSEPGDENITLSLEKSGKGIHIFIVDSGPGIPAEQMPYIFEPFYRVDGSRSRKKGGYGLGLSLSRKIMRAHGGDMEIKNNPGRGVTVILFFEGNGNEESTTGAGL